LAFAANCAGVNVPGDCATDKDAHASAAAATHITCFIVPSSRFS